MGACLSAHFVSRPLRQLGHEPRIIPAIYVKPFVKGQKNDYNDAVAIAEASMRPNLRTVRERRRINSTSRPTHIDRERPATLNSGLEIDLKAAIAGMACDEGDAPRGAAMGQRDAGLGRAGESRGDAGHDLECDPVWSIN
jgi:transposase